MILLLLVLPVALAVIGWIAWLAFGPRHSSFVDHIIADKQLPENETDEMMDAFPSIDSEFQLHLLTRLETSPIPIESHLGVQALTRIASSDRGLLYPASDQRKRA